MDNLTIIIIMALAILGLVILLKILMFRVLPFIDQYLLMQEQDLSKRYGNGKNQKDNSWVLITGPSSGMGERFAYEFADRRFNLLLVGSKRTKRVIRSIKKRCPEIQIKFIEVDFSNSFTDSFFDQIEKEVDLLGSKWKILINNVGYRTFSLNYEDMPLLEMKKTIAVGTLVQANLIQMALQTFSKIKSNTAIVNITAQNTIPSDLFAIDTDLTVPHLACYEATNVFGYCHAKSIYAEIKDKYPLIDFLIITPGAVRTKTTEPVLKDVIFSVDADTFVKNILKLMGNKNGIYSAHWGHSLSGALINLFPFFDRDSVMKKIGTDFSNSRKH
jgi:short-subunit dehydrogenase